MCRLDEKLAYDIASLFYEMSLNTLLSWKIRVSCNCGSVACRYVLARGGRHSVFADSISELQTIVPASKEKMEMEKAQRAHHDSSRTRRLGAKCCSQYFQ